MNWSIAIIIHAGKVPLWWFNVGPCYSSVDLLNFDHFFSSKSRLRLFFLQTYFKICVFSRAWKLKKIEKQKPKLKAWKRRNFQGLIFRQTDRSDKIQSITWKMWNQETVSLENFHFGRHSCCFYVLNVQIASLSFSVEKYIFASKKSKGIFQSSSERIKDFFIKFITSSQRARKQSLIDFCLNIQSIWEHFSPGDVEERWKCANSKCKWIQTTYQAPAKKG